MILITGIVICVILELFHTPIIAMFLDDAPSAETLAIGASYLKFMGFFYSLVGFKMAVDGMLRGAGDVKMMTSPILSISRYGY